MDAPPHPNPRYCHTVLGTQVLGAFYVFSVPGHPPRGLSQPRTRGTQTLRAERFYSRLVTPLVSLI